MRSERCCSGSGRHGSVAIFIDEFDRLRDPHAPVLFADTIKALSDRGVPATLFLIGVADSVAELISEHRSVERALVQIHMPRMSRSELAEIANTGLAAARMTIAPAALKKVTAVSQGLPHYTQLLTQLAARAALAQHRAGVGGGDVDSAVERAVERAQGSVTEAFRVAMARPARGSTRRSCWPARSRTRTSSGLRRRRSHRAAEQDPRQAVHAADLRSPPRPDGVRSARAVLQRVEGGRRATASRIRSCSRTC